jgi:hypothetical protein
MHIPDERGRPHRRDGLAKGVDQTLEEGNRDHDQPDRQGGRRTPGPVR